MARPTKEGSDKRSLVVRVRVTEVEKRLLEELAFQAGLSISDLLRVRSLGAPPAQKKPTPVRENLLLLLAELGKQGSNINQIARALNRRDGGELIGLPLNVISYALEENRALAQLIRKELQHGH